MFKRSKILKHVRLEFVCGLFFAFSSASAADLPQADLSNPSSVSYSTWIKQQDTNASAKEKKVVPPATKVKPSEARSYIDSASKILEAEQRDIAKTEQALNEQKSKIAIIKDGIEYANSLNARIEELNRQLQATKNDLVTTQEVVVKADKRNQELAQVAEVSKDLSKTLDSEKAKNAAIRKQLELLSTMMQEQADAEANSLKRELNLLESRKEKMKSVVGK